MASLGGDRDKLLRAFLSQAKKRRKKPGKPGRITTGTPRPGQGANAVFSRFRSGEPPYLPNFVPGYGQAKQERAARKIGQYQAKYDTQVNRLHQQDNYGPPMRPRAGSTRKRRGDRRLAANRGNRPTLN